ncbi:MAG: beta-N-acetylhexosaminidase [Flavobacteriales bacterium]|jgi:beta-glucosidase-like glycosyl hydrolase/CubicO group peptidase (beta-lactamase class C family)
MSLKKTLLYITFLSVSSAIFAQQSYPLYTYDIEAQRTWVDSVYSGMSSKERVGQLFMVDILSSDPKAKIDKVRALIKEQHIGGIIFLKGGPMRQAKLNNEFQAASKVPLLVGMDAEWGLAMRLDSTYAFPWNMTLGAIKDNRIVEKVGKRIGEHCKRLGVHINFGPVADINVNPANPIIGNRSFGEDKINVTEKAIAFAKGMQGTGVLGSAKHFPGHGDTDQDSHKTLPTLDFTRQRLDSIEMYPYKPIIQAGIASVMVAHLNVPNLVSEKGFPTSISPTVVTSILKDSLQFHGLIVTDALNMKGAANFKNPGDIDLAAFKAGNDILLISEDVGSASAKILAALTSGGISEERLAHSVKKILYAKYKVGLQNYAPIVTKNLIADLNTLEDDMIYSEAIESAITITKNSNQILPVSNLDAKKIAYVALGDAKGTYFLKQMQKYATVRQINIEDTTDLKKLAPYNYVIVGFHRSNDNPWKSYGFNAKQKMLLAAIAKEKDVVLDLFVRPYAMLDVGKAPLKGIIHSYQNSRLSQEKSAQLIFGAIPSIGKLPVTLGATMVGSGFESGILRRLQYGIPEEVGINSDTLTKKIDSLMKIGLRQAMMPGAQVLVARHGKVIYEKSFGYHTYNKKQKVKLDDVYDVASMTKILATLPMLMELHSQGSLDLNASLGSLIPELKGTNKSRITVKKALSHYAQFKAWIPFYVKTLDSVTKKPSDTYYKKNYSDDFNIKIVDGMYLRSDYQDSIISIIGESDLRERLNYKYSDLPYYLMKKYLEDYYGKDLDKITAQRLYRILGATRTGYIPLNKFKKSDIVPSENDTYWRNQRIQGYVHDMGAAMQSNIGGHAGLFSNANDVAKIMQMYVQDGYYGGKRFISKATVDTFNTCNYCAQNVRRGVGFDKPQLSGSGPTCGCVPMSSFGHSGFTGTYTWADPENGLVYVFLSNRTFPTMDNRKLIKSGLRTEIQAAIYKSFID